jgi:alkylation response protein AidB-like acyl-CoA dehydrogenase
MIDFTLSDEHRLLEQSIREWGAREVLPFIHDNDRKHHFDRDAFSAAWRSWACSASRFRRNMAAPAWTTSPSVSPAEDSVSRYLAARDHVGARRPELPVAAGVDARKQKRYLVPQAQGKMSGYGLTEPGAGGDARISARRPRRSRGDRYILNGGRPGSRWPTSPIRFWSSLDRPGKKKAAIPRA